MKINWNKCGPKKGLNKDMGAYVKTDIWNPLLHTMDTQCNLASQYHSKINFSPIGSPLELHQKNVLS